jgi:hypothetical protein
MFVIGITKKKKKRKLGGRVALMGEKYIQGFSTIALRKDSTMKT